MINRCDEFGLKGMFGDQNSKDDRQSPGETAEMGKIDSGRPAGIGGFYEIEIILKSCGNRSEPPGQPCECSVIAVTAAECALVVVLHGCAQTAAGYDLGAGWSTLANRYGFALLLPEQQRSNNPNGCFNWFQTPAISSGGEGRRCPSDRWLRR